MSARRLGVGDASAAKCLFATMARVFGEHAEELSDAQVEALLADPRFWAVATFEGDDVIGGATAHAIPMTYKPGCALFVYDVAVRPDRQRRGIGRELIAVLREAAARQGIDEIFVLADDEDTHALDFYRSLGAVASAVTMFDLGATR